MSSFLSLNDYIKYNLFSSLLITWPPLPYLLYNMGDLNIGNRTRVTVTDALCPHFDASQTCQQPGGQRCLDLSCGERKLKVRGVSRY